jgi:SAM-dependent methyltransferase
MLRTTLVVFLAAFSTLAAAQAQKAPATYEPQSGQAGKDVVWVPTPQILVDRMLDMARVTPADFVMDLGSGDGRTVITAAKRGARAVGIEYNPDMVALSRRNAEKEGVAGKAIFIQGDIFKTDFSQASVITLFLLPSLNLKLRPTILNLKPGTRVVSNSFTMDEWTPDDTVSASSDANCTSFCIAYFWVVPAKVAGTYKTPHGELTLTQTFQMLAGTLAADGVKLKVEGKVIGEEIAFSAGGREYRGRMNGKNLELR